MPRTEEEIIPYVSIDFVAPDKNTLSVANAITIDYRLKIIFTCWAGLLNQWIFGTKFSGLHTSLGVTY